MLGGSLCCCQLSFLLGCTQHGTMQRKGVDQVKGTGTNLQRQTKAGKFDLFVKLIEAILHAIGAARDCFN